MTARQRTTIHDLKQILFEYSKYSPLYGDRLANHLPMAVTALWKLGADFDTMQRFCRNYEKRLRLRSGPCEKDIIDCPELGAGHFEQNVSFFRRLIAESGLDAAMRDWLPRLIPGLSASAFHGLIRTAYAWEGNSPNEVADALAFWASEYTELPKPLLVQNRSCREIIAEVVAHFQNARRQDGIIVDKMLAVSENPYFANGFPAPLQISLNEIREAVLHVYQHSEDFTLLHTVTSTHATRVLLPLIADHQSATELLWKAILLAIATVSDVIARNPHCVSNETMQVSWEIIIKTALLSHDDHVIKLVYTASDESRLGNADAYRRIAARKVDLL